MRLTSNRPCSTKPNYANGSDHKRNQNDAHGHTSNADDQRDENDACGGKSGQNDAHSHTSSAYGQRDEDYACGGRGVRMMPTVALAVAAPPITRGGMKTK